MQSCFRLPVKSCVEERLRRRCVYSGTKLLERSRLSVIFKSKLSASVQHTSSSTRLFSHRSLYLGYHFEMTSSVPPLCSTEIFGLMESSGLHHRLVWLSRLELIALAIVVTSTCFDHSTKTNELLICNTIYKSYATKAKASKQCCNS